MWNRMRKSLQSKRTRYVCKEIMLASFGLLTPFYAQIDVAVNAPEAGTIKEFLASEEDTVTVGQDLVKLELGGAPQSGEEEQGNQEPKAPASDEQATSSDPDPSKEDSKSEQDTSVPPPPPQGKKPEPPKQEIKSETSRKEPTRQDPPPSKPSESTKSEPKGSSSPAPYGSREERRVYLDPLTQKTYG